LLPPQGNLEPAKCADSASTPCEQNMKRFVMAPAGGQEGLPLGGCVRRAYLDGRVHDLAHLGGADGGPAMAVEERVQPPRRRRRRHVDEGVALIVLCPAPQTPNKFRSDRKKAAYARQ
jgi:hypothetical protein